MAEASTQSPSKVPERPPVLLWACELRFKAAPFRAERLARIYLPAVAKARDYGCKGYSFLRSDQEPEEFVHTSYWESKADFKQYWLSRELEPIRQGIVGLHDQPLVPSWYQVLEHRGTSLELG